MAGIRSLFRKKVSEGFKGALGIDSEIRREACFFRSLFHDIPYCSQVGFLIVNALRD